MSRSLKTLLPAMSYLILGCSGVGVRDATSLPSGLGDAMDRVTGQMSHRSEVVVRFSVCGDGSMASEGIAARLRSAGYYVQTSDAGWSNADVVVLRFRKKDVIGDVYGGAGASGASGCRAFVVRMMWKAGAGFPRWQSQFGDNVSFGRCLIFFEDDVEFPLPWQSYSWGCDANDRASPQLRLPD